MRIVVLCNDRLAVPALQVLIQNRLLLAVGIPEQLSEPTQFIQQLCTQSGVPVQLFPRKNFEGTLSAWLQQNQPDVVLVKTFPWKIPAALLQVVKHGFINFHYAPLPEFRGPSPLFWMIRNRVPEIGVSVHKMDATLDTGDVLLQKRVPLSPEMTMGMCTAQLAFMGAELTGPLLQGLVQNLLPAVPQQTDKAAWYKRPAASDLQISWNEMTAAEVKALVKACNPWAKGAVTSWNGWKFGITDVTLSAQSAGDHPAPGTVAAIDEEKGLLIACKDGLLVRADVIYTEEGYFPGHRLSTFGLSSGNVIGR